MLKSLYQILTQQAEKRKNPERQKKKTSFPNELVENADFYKPKLNKIMITYK